MRLTETVEDINSLCGGQSLVVFLAVSFECFSAVFLKDNYLNLSLKKFSRFFCSFNWLFFMSALLHATMAGMAWAIELISCVGVLDKYAPHLCLLKAIISIALFILLLTFLANNPATVL